MKNWLLFSSCCLLLLSCESSPNEAPPATGVPLALARERAQRLSEVRYDLRFELPADQADAIPARLTVSFELRDADRSLALDFKADSSQVLSVSREGEPVDFLFKKEHLLLPANALTEGENQITIDFLAGDLSLNRSDDYLYTLLVPDRARTLFPCFDQPDIKARYRLSLGMPGAWEAVANGAEEKVVAAGDRKSIAYAETKPIPTYLFAFAAGRFRKLSKTVNGRPMTMYFRETDDQKVQANADTVFGLHAAALAWLEDYTGIPYPFEKFDFALIPGFQYGGMEHPGAIFYREPSLFLDESATENQQLRRASLIAHETAHMWFGDLVTMQWFNDVWLKEVFANFMAAKIVNPSFPDINHELRFLLAHQPAAYSEDRSEGSHPIQQELENLQEAGTLYGRIIYQKAPVVMRQLEQRMGEAAFRDGLCEYLNAFPYGNATWDDLVGILAGHTGQELSEWSRAWVKEAGMPVINCVPEVSNGQIERLELKQENTSSGGRYWPQYTEVTILYSDTVRRLPVDISGELTTVPAATGFSAPLAVLPNGSAMSYGYFRPDSTSRDFLLTHIGSVSDPLLRGAGRMSLYEACLRGELSPETLMEALLTGLPSETDALNREEIMGYIETLYWRFFRPEERQALAPRLEGMLWALLQQAPDVSTRAAYFRTYRSLALTPTAAERLYRIWQGALNISGLPLSENDRIDLAVALALRLPDRAEAILDAQLDRTANPDRKQQLTFVRPALSPEPSVRDSFFESLKRPENRHYEPWVVEAVGYLHHPLRAGQSEKYILPSLELMEEIQATGDIFFPRQWITATLSGHQTATAAATVRRFLAQRPDYPYRLRNKILMGADLLLRGKGKEGNDGSSSPD